MLCIICCLFHAYLDHCGFKDGLSKRAGGQLIIFRQEVGIYWIGSDYCFAAGHVQVSGIKQFEGFLLITFSGVCLGELVRSRK